MKIIRPTTTIRKSHLYIGGIILVVILSSFSGVGYKYLKKQEKVHKERINSYKKDIDSLNVIVLDSETYINEILNTKEDDFYNEYVREYNKRIKAEKELTNIKHLTHHNCCCQTLTKD